MKNIAEIKAKANKLSKNLLATHQEFERQLAILEFLPKPEEQNKALEQLNDLITAWEHHE